MSEILPLLLPLQGLEIISANDCVQEQGRNDDPGILSNPANATDGVVGL